MEIHGESFYISISVHDTNDNRVTEDRGTKKDSLVENYNDYKGTSVSEDRENNGSSKRVWKIENYKINTVRIHI